MYEPIYSYNIIVYTVEYRGVHIYSDYGDYIQ